MFFFFLFLFLVVFFFKIFNFRKLYFAFYLDFTKVQSYLDQKFRSFFSKNQLVPVGRAQIRFFKYFYFSSVQVPFFLKSGKFYYYTFNPHRSAILHSGHEPQPYFLYFFYFIFFTEPRLRVYNFFGNYIFIFL